MFTKGQQLRRKNKIIEHRDTEKNKIKRILTKHYLISKLRNKKT